MDELRPGSDIVRLVAFDLAPTSIPVRRGHRRVGPPGRRGVRPVSLERWFVEPGIGRVRSPLGRRVYITNYAVLPPVPPANLGPAVSGYDAGVRGWPFR